MSITTRTVIVPRLWRGYLDPGLPSGGYISNVISVGNGTGGNHAVAFQFKPQLEAASGRYYNIEQINMFASDATARTVSLQLVQFEEVGNLGIATRHDRFRLVGDGTGNATIDYGQLEPPPFPMFLGKTTRTVSLFSEVVFSTLNVDLVVLGVTIQGYIWDPRSTMSPGGLRRPLDSLYGR